jgi:enoyl-CoA hydratase
MTTKSNQIVVTRIAQRGEAGRVAYVTVNNPDERNALGRRGKEELIAAFQELARDDELRVVVLTGAGNRAFIAGANLKEMAKVDWRDAEDIST